MLRNLLTSLVLAAVPALASAQAIVPGESGTLYGQARGWTVYTMGDESGVFACRAVRGSTFGDQIMLNYSGQGDLADFDKGAWTIIVQARRTANDDGLGVRGAGAHYDSRFIDKQVGFGRSPSYAAMPVGPDELNLFRQGSTFRLDIIGEPSRSWPLSGSAAAALKVEECAQSWGMMAAAAVPPPAPAAPPTTAAPQPSTPAVTGFNVGYVRFPGGQFVDVGGGEWTEEGDNGSRSNFQIYDNNPNGVFLNDPSRNLQIWISLSSNEILWTNNFDGNWKVLYGIDCFDTQASRAC